MEKLIRITDPMAVKMSARVRKCKEFNERMKLLKEEFHAEFVLDNNGYISHISFIDEKYYVMCLLKLTT